MQYHGRLDDSTKVSSDSWRYSMMIRTAHGHILDEVHDAFDSFSNKHKRTWGAEAFWAVELLVWRHDVLFVER